MLRKNDWKDFQQYMVYGGAVAEIMGDFWFLLCVLICFQP